MVGLGEWVMYFMTVAIVFLMAVLTGKRGLCHYLCWVSPFMIIGGKIRDLLRIPSLRLITKPDLCNSCGLCSRVCPMSLPIDELIKNGEIGHSECTLCSTCIDSCPKGVIKFAFRRSQKNKKELTITRMVGLISFAELVPKCYSSASQFRFRSVLGCLPASPHYTRQIRYIMTKASRDTVGSPDHVTVS